MAAVAWAVTGSIGSADVVVRGAGVAGLWTARALARAGYSVVVVSRGAVGGGQTIASQGIIHGGIKYALTGTASAASKAIAGMPEVWAKCLRGEGEVDLRGVKVLSPRQYLWTTGSLGSKLVGVAASKAIRTAVRRVDAAERPEGLAGAGRGVDVYVVEEMVLEPRSVVRELIRGLVIVREDEGNAADQQEATASGGKRVSVWCAGNGNPAEMTQKRGLHMVMVRSEGLPAVYGHCVGGDVLGADKPRVTITSQRDAAGRMVWYVGGQVAETGVQRGREEQIEAAKRELAECVGWVDLGGAEWATLRVDRAERKSAGGVRPDVPVVERVVGAGRELAAWPTKLAFAPMLAGMVVEEVGRMGAKASGAVSNGRVDVEVAALPWDAEDVVWS